MLQSISLHSVKCFKLLIQYKLDDKTRKKISQQYIHMLLRWGSEECLKILISAGILEIDYHNKNIDTPLSLAVDRNYMYIAKLLIAFGADVNYKNSRGNSLLFIAIKNGHMDMANLLLQSGARFYIDKQDNMNDMNDMNDIKDMNGMNDIKDLDYINGMNNMYAVYKI